MEISSFQNPKIKQLIKLQQKSRERNKQNLFVVEGIQENQMALENCFEPVQTFVCQEIFDDAIELLKVEIFYITKDIFQKIAYRQTTGGIIGIYRLKRFDLNEITTNNPFLVVLEGIEKPGNLGAILRSCDAANIDAVVVCDKKIDFFNPNVIRSSVGTIFTNKIIACDKEELVKYCHHHHITISASFLRKDSQNLYDLNCEKALAMVFGTESTGLSDYWLDQSDVTFKIPMAGKVDSLNVSNAVAISIFEGVRQRKF